MGKNLERSERWARENAAAVTRREKNIVRKKRQQEVKPADTVVEWRVVSRYKGRVVYLEGGICGVLWTAGRGKVWGERDAKRNAKLRRGNLQAWAAGVGTGIPDEVEVLGGAGRPTRIERATGVLAREMFDNLVLERTEVNRWNLARAEWAAVEEASEGLGG